MTWPPEIGIKPFYADKAVVIYHGDCRDVVPKLPKESIRLLWTDPPYGHDNQNGDLQAARIRDDVRGARKAPAEPIGNDSPDEMRVIVSSMLDSAKPIMSPDCCCCCCCCCGGGPKPTFAWTATRLDSDGWEFFHAVVWDKSDRGNGMGWRFRRNYEFVMVAHLRNKKLAWAQDNVAEPNVMRIQPPINRLHPNEKPVELVKKFVSLTTQVGEIILDPFAGSGTTGRAAKDLNRRAILVEISEAYCEIAASRMRQQVFEW